MTTATHHDPDVGRRVLQCRCGRAREWTSREDAIDAGWGARWVEERRVWECPSCYVPPAPAPVQPPNLAPPEQLVAFARGTAVQRQRAQRDLTAMLSADPERGRAWAIAVLDLVADGKSDRAKEWRAWAAKHGLRKQQREAMRRRRGRAPSS